MQIGAEVFPPYENQRNEKINIFGNFKKISHLIVGQNFPISDFRKGGG